MDMDIKKKWENNLKQCYERNQNTTAIDTISKELIYELKEIKMQNSLYGITYTDIYVKCRKLIKSLKKCYETEEDTSISFEEFITKKLAGFPYLTEYIILNHLNK